MKNLSEIADHFESIVECEEGECGRCDSIREHVKFLRFHAALVDIASGQRSLDSGMQKVLDDNFFKLL